MTKNGNATLRASFNDLEHFCEVTRRWDLDFQPLGKFERGGILAEIVQNQYGEVSFDAARLRVPIDQVGTPPANRHTFGVLASRMKALFWRGQNVESSDVLVFHEGAELGCTSGPDFENFCVSVSESYVEMVAEREQVPLPSVRRRPEVFRPSSNLLSAARNVLTACRDSDPNVTDAFVGQVTDQIIISWLSYAGLHRRKSQDTKREAVLFKSIEYIHEFPLEQISIADLSVISGASRRTLEYAFRDQLGVGRRSS